MQVVVANDASTDATGEVVQRIAESSAVPVRVLSFPSRQGPARARNAALEAATGELVVFVDSDVIVPEVFVEAHLAAHREAGPRVYVMGALIYVDSVAIALQAPLPTVWDFSSRRWGR